jgi:hypothetical protein
MNISPHFSMCLILGVCVTPVLAQNMPRPWTPVVYAHRVTGTGAASLRVHAAELIRTGTPRQVDVRAVLRFVPETEAWERLAIRNLPSVQVPVPPARQVYSGDTDPVLLVIPQPVGLFWARWDEDGHRVSSYLYAGPTLCNDVMLGPPPPGRVAVCIPFREHAEARFVPHPGGH